MNPAYVFDTPVTQKLKVSLVVTSGRRVLTKERIARRAVIEN